MCAVVVQYVIYQKVFWYSVLPQMLNVAFGFLDYGKTYRRADAVVNIYAVLSFEHMRTSSGITFFYDYI